MSQSTTEYGILVAVDGSPESDGAVRWAAREAVLRDAAVTLMHVIAPVEVRWPVRSLQASFDEWQEDNAQDVIEQAQKTLQASLGHAKPPAVRAVVKRSAVAGTLINASRKAQMVVVGSRGMGALGRAVLGRRPALGPLGQTGDRVVPRRPHRILPVAAGAAVHR
jgi:nucleotide-binding universal stress UspA family protein